MRSKFLTDDQLSRHDIEKLKQFVRRRLGGYRVMLKDIARGQRLYRGVEWNERPTLVDHLGAPPAERCTTWGRAHRPGRPMFYASAGPPVCFYEIRSKTGSYVALSEWEVSRSFWMHNLGYHYEALKRLGVKDIGMRALLAHPIENESKDNAHTRLRLSLSFTDDIPEEPQWNYRYKRSVAVFELLFDKSEPLQLLPDGVSLPRAGGAAYPAMRLMGMADNMAIFPEFVAEALRLRRVLWIKVVEVDASRHFYKLETEAEATDFDGGSIHWQDLTGDAVGRQTSIWFEEEQWKMKTGRAGTFYGP